MNIQTVADNLRNTIAGKEELLALCPETEKNINIRAFLKVNIDELKRILQDVEQCCEQATLDSWTRNPDRSGGQFTEEEINRGNEWR